MPTFLTIGYGDQDGYDRTDSGVRDRAHEHDERLKARGARISRAGTPVQVQQPDGTSLERRDGPFMKSDLPIAGFAIIEADDLDHAVELVAHTPCAVAHGVVEVWPFID